MSLDNGDTAPDFELPVEGLDGRDTLSLSDYRGQPVVLYFYPKDNTPGCTLEAQDFRDLHDVFRKLGAEVLGISRDSVSSHAKFREKQDLNFPLVSDPDEIACRSYKVIKEKKMYGRTSMGVERSTFLIDGNGKIAHAWRGVKVKGHAQKVLETLQSL